jgi:carbamoyl-phosphate synthase small subunit
MQAILRSKTGAFSGRRLRAPGECLGEVVFNTSLTGYQEIATDPSYAGQIVVLTNPQIGNYGTNLADNEAAKPLYRGPDRARVLAVSSNWRSEQVTDEYMERYKVPVLAEIDTRALVRHLRNHGVMRGVISTSPRRTPKSWWPRRGIRKMDGTDLAKVVSTKTSSRLTRTTAATRRTTAAGDPEICRTPASRFFMWWLTISASSSTFCAC